MFNIKFYEFVSSNQAVADAGKALVIDTLGKVVPTAIGSSSKLPYQRRTFWTQKVDCHNPITNFNIHTLNDLDPVNIYEDKCVLYLPDSYTPDGDPTKVILFCKQGASEITSSSDTIVDQCTFFLKLGYAILAVEGIPDGLCDEKKIGKRTVGNYIHAQSMTKAYERIVELYNIDPKGCYAYGWSQGGHTLQNLLDNTSLPILCAAAQSPVVSMRYHQWDLAVTATRGGVSYTKDARLSVARLFDYPAVSTNAELLALSYDESKTNGWDPYTRNVDNPYTGFVQSGNIYKLPTGTTIDDITTMRKRMRCPYKAWIADNDSTLGSDVTKVFVKAIKNSGQVAEVKCYSTGAHSIPAAQTTIATFEEHGVTQNLKPLYLEMAQWFEKYGGYSTEEYSPTPGPTPDPDALPLTDYALSVTAAAAGKVSSMSTRISTGSPDTANGILVPSRMAITITGLKPTGYPTLRVDGLWATSSGPNPLASGSSTPWSEVVGTISNYDANNYLPLNADGSSDTVTVENNTDNDYYYFFAFAATNKTDVIQAANYDLHYSIDEIPEPEPSGTLPLYSNIMMSVTPTDGGQIFDTAQGQTGKRLSSGSSTVATGILVKNGESITLTGLQSSGHPTLKVDYLYCTSAGPAPYAGTISGVWNQVVGTGSNWVSANYFPLNTDGNNTITVTNTTGSDYYYFFCFCGPTKAESVDSSWYNITYEIEQGPVLTTLPTHQYALSVTSTGAGGVTSSANNRLCSGSTTAAEGVLVKNGETITLYGLQSTGNPTLRVDALWANSAGPNPLSTSGVWSETVGTLSNYVAADYFPLNADGSSNSVSITNNNGNDYYYFFAFAATDKTSNISVGNYTITYEISE